MRTDQLDRAMKMDASFLVNRDPVRASIGERRDVKIRILDHQVAVDRDVHRLAKAFEHGRANGDVRDKVSVHYIEVQESSSAGNGGGCLLSEPRKISGKYGRRQ